MSTADPDDEKTVTGPPAPGRRPAGDDAVTGIEAERRRGRAAEAHRPGHTLPFGTRLLDYEITGLIGEGGFGIVYLAWDHSLQRRVAIKEYMPASMTARIAGSSAIVVKSERHLDTFRAGLKSFVNEARLLARFDHPSLVKVYRFWEENGTAYMAMPYYEGPTLKAALAARAGPPSEAELRAWLRPLLDALELMHRAQCYHRDIAPDNILLTPRGPLLLDFGAARRVIGDMTHAITVVLKPGYAPIEQYGDVATMTQGPWTDLYALASVVYFAIAGKTPTSSVERLMDDRLVPLKTTAAGRYSEELLGAVDAALALRPSDRPQDVRQFRALLDAGLPPPPAAADSGWSSGWGRAPSTLEPDASEPAPTRAEPRAAGPVAADPHAGVRRAAERGAPVAGAGAHRRPLLLAITIGAVVAVLAAIGALQTRPAQPDQAGAAASAVEPRTPLAMPSPASVPTPVIVDRAPPTPSPLPSPAPAPAITDNPPLATAAPSAPTAQAPPKRPASADERPPETAAATVDGRPDRTSSPVPRPPAQPRRESAVPRSDAPPRPAPPRTVGSRCSDILQKASLEPLTASEAEYLKRECR